MIPFERLFDQVDPSGAAGIPEPLLNTVVIDDQHLIALDRATDLPPDRSTDVTVINSTGAGGITAVAGRSLTSLRLAAIETALRDPADLVGNIARIAAAARDLDPDVTVLVDIPDGFGWEDAVAAAEAEGLVAVAHWSDPDPLAAQLSAYVEADLPFVVDDVGSAGALIGLLVAVDALIEDGDPVAAAKLLGDLDHDQQIAMIKSWDDHRSGRVRRRLRAVRAQDLSAVVAELEAAGLVT